MNIINRRNLERGVIIVLACMAALFLTGEPSRLELGLLDLRFAVNRGGGSGEFRQVAVVLVDTRTEAELGRLFDSSWRDLYPQLIAGLEAAGATGIVWDAAFAESRPDLDPALAARLQEGVPVVAGSGPGSAVAPSLRDAFAGVGWLAFVGSDSIPRRIPAGTDPPPLALVAAPYLPEPPARLPARDVDIWIDYSRDLSRIPRFSMIDLLRAESGRLADERRTPASIFRDRLVFVGQDLPAYDRYQLPGTQGARVPGVFAQVAATLTVAQQFQISRPPRWADWLIAVAIATLLVVSSTLSNRILRRSFTGAAVIVGLVVPVLLFSIWRVWMSYSAVLAVVVIPLIAVAVVRRIWLTRSYRTSLGFDPALIQRHRDLIESYSTGVEREAAVLCSDVRDYTQFVTDHAPDLVQRVMSEYMAAMEQVVDSFGGYVNKYVGDEIVAVFGFPREEKRCVERSVQAALAMLDKLKELQESWRSRGLPVLQAIGIGLDAGPLRFTHIGGRHRVQFDVIGNPINGASRLQTLTKEHKRPLIIPAEVVEEQQELDVVMYGTPPDQVPERAVTFLGEVMVRGQGRRRVYGLTAGPSHQ